MPRTTPLRLTALVGLLAAGTVLGGCGSTGERTATATSSTTATTATTTTTTTATTATSGAAAPDAAATTASSDPSTSTSSSSTTTSSSTTSPTSTATTSPSTATTGPTKPAGTTTPDDGILRAGDEGARVEAAQRRLTALGYWLGTPDGSYGTSTQQAVMALQKAAGISRDGTLGPRTMRALRDGVRPTPRTTSGDAVDVDLTHQLLMVVEHGRLTYTFNTSTGSGRSYVSDGRTYRAYTPTGTFAVQRQIDGMRTSRLGQLWRPKYFTGGWAFHGASSVPAYPASHGCARLTNAAIDFVWSSGSAPIGRTVVVYGASA